MNLDLTTLLVLGLLALVSWNIYLTIGKKKNDDDQTNSNRLDNIHDLLDGLRGHVGEFQEPLKKLNSYLSGGTQAGVFGEWSLDAIMRDIFSPDKFETNCEIIPGTGQTVEFALKLPEGLVPIDAKFPSGLYDNYIEASGKKRNKAAVNTAIKEIRRHVISDAKDIKEKYMQVGITIGLGVMYIPSESLMQLIDSIGDIRREVFRDSRVLIMGPNSLAAFLISILMGFENLTLNERAEEILGEIGKMRKEFEKFGDSTGNLRIKADAMVTAVQQYTTRENQMSRALERMEDLEQIEEVPEE